MKITYRKPEIVDLTGMDALGRCTSGSGATSDCLNDGNGATYDCSGDGNGALTYCDNGNAPG